MWLVATCGLVLACSGSDDMFETTRSATAIESREITGDELPETFDDARTYWAQQAVHAPVAEIRTLLNQGFAVTRAWNPLDDRCYNPTGPRFTVELAADDPRVLDAGFERGVGFLGCAERLTQYTVTGD